MSKGSNRLSFHLSMRREPLTIALLTGLTIVSFSFVAGLSRLYFAQQESLAVRWSTRGAAALKANNFSDAVTDFRTALLYSRGNDEYQLRLSEALLGLGRKNPDYIDEAYVYLINLWDRQPDNGRVNLELARIAASRGTMDRAIRYYHNAIYATWPASQESERQKARLELIELFLRSHANAQAQSELIALAANLGDDPAERAHVGDLFMQAQDYSQALAQFELSLRGNPRSAIALAGAGRAAFERSRYLLARRYLARAVELDPGDKDSKDRLRIVDLVLELDPFRQQIRAAERNRVVVKDFALAGTRIDTCQLPGAGPPTAASTQRQALATTWGKLKPKVTEWRLRRNPDLVNTAMELVFDIERQTVGACGPQTDSDTALILIANMHEGI